MMDGRFDQQLAELFATTLADQDKKGGPSPLWPLAVACIAGIVVFACAVALA